MSSRTRPRSAKRQWFLTTIQAQITGTRVLAVLTFFVLAGGAAYWLTGTTGSPIVAIYFIALAGVLSVTIYAFLRLMGGFIRPLR
ncbi:MAG: hypothetical protein ACR2NO_00680 [Chloroflexota bacterium]